MWWAVIVGSIVGKLINGELKNLWRDEIIVNQRSHWFEQFDQKERYES